MESLFEELIPIVIELLVEVLARAFGDSLRGGTGAASHPNRLF